MTPWKLAACAVVGLGLWCLALGTAVIVAAS